MRSWSCRLVIDAIAADAAEKAAVAPGVTDTAALTAAAFAALAIAVSAVMAAAVNTAMAIAVPSAPHRSRLTMRSDALRTRWRPPMRRWQTSGRGCPRCTRQSRRWRVGSRRSGCVTSHHLYVCTIHG